jgi:hypothetical protein
MLSSDMLLMGISCASAVLAHSWRWCGVVWCGVVCCKGLLWWCDGVMVVYCWCVCGAVWWCIVVLCVRWWCVFVVCLWWVSCAGGTVFVVRSAVNDECHITHHETSHHAHITQHLHHATSSHNHIFTSILCLVAAERDS